MSFEQFCNTLEKHEATASEDSEFYEFTESDLEIVRKNPAEFEEFLIFISTRKMPKEDKARVEEYLKKEMKFDDDKEA